MVPASAKMPYYCTVPRCTSMAGKAKNVSFHQFPRDEELAKLWNRILKRGKPYTKYSKVCSLHFKPEDYTITSVGKNKGQWRTLRKDAIPSQNLPSESPAPYTRRPSDCWTPSQPNLTDPLVQQQMAQAIYMQTMLAMQAAGASDSVTPSEPPQIPESTKPSPSSSMVSEIELLLRRDTDAPKEVTYKCHECSKCFKDPDVFVLHKRTHKTDTTLNIEKENYSANIQDREETLRANPILANLLKTSMRLEPESNMANILTVENQIMAALASNMEAYIRTLSSMLASQTNAEDRGQDGFDYDETKDDEGDGVERDAAKVKCEADMSVDADECDTPMNEDEADRNRNEDEVMKVDNNDIRNSISNQITASGNKVESPIGEDISKHSSETKCIDEIYTMKDENCEALSDTQIDENESNASEDESIHDNIARNEMREASNDAHKSTSSKETEKREEYEQKNDATARVDHNEMENAECLEKDTSVDENQKYTDEDKITDDMARKEAQEANETLVNVHYSVDENQKYTDDDKITDDMARKEAQEANETLVNVHYSVDENQKYTDEDKITDDMARKEAQEANETLVNVHYKYASEIDDNVTAKYEI